jgi:hypothetical protein
MIRDGDVSVRLGVGLPGLWWVALSWGEPVIPWWRHHRHRGQPRWDGWGGPRIVNNVVIKQTTVINVRDIHFHNATLPRGILTVPADKFGRERIRATVENRYRPTDFAPVRGELPVKPTRASLFGGAPKGVQPPREIAERPVVSTRAPRERPLPIKDAAPRARTQAVPDAHYVIPPARRVEDKRALPRPPLGAEAGPERTPPPRPPRYQEMRRSIAPTTPPATRTQAITREQTPERRSVQPATRPAQPAVIAPSAPATRSQNTTREQATVREQATERREVRPTQPAPTVREQATERRQVIPPARPAQPSVAAPPAAAPQRGEVRQDGRERPLPGQPASQIYRGRDRDSRNPR